MPIAFRYTGESRTSDMSFGGDFIVLCELCGKEIDREVAGNVDIPKGDEGEIAPAYFLHRECSLAYRTALQNSGKPADFNWLILDEIEVKTK